MPATDITPYSLRLDRSCVFLPADTNTNTKTCVTGSLHLNLSQPIWVKGIKVKLTGKLRIPRDEYAIVESYHEGITFEQSQSLAASKTLSSFCLPAGKYEFPFGIPVDKNIFETVTGPSHEYHSYQVNAIIERRFAKDIIVSQPVRIYKSNDLDAIDSWQDSSPASVDNYWDGKIDYCVSIPEKNIPFGSTFPVEFRFQPLTKGLKVESIRLKILEKHRLKIVPTAAQSVQYNLRFFTLKKEHTIFDETHFCEDIMETDPDALYGEQCTTKLVRLPQKLVDCTQNAESGMVRIEHEVRFSVGLRNADGHLSLIAGSLPIYIFMSPTVISENGTVHGQNMQELQRKQDPPPLYGDHLRDSIIDLCLSLGDDGCGDLTGPEQIYGNDNDNVPSYETAIISCN